MSIVTPLNESNFQPVEPFKLSFEMATVNSITFDTATGSFDTLQDTVGVIASDAAVGSFVIVYTDQNKTKVSSVTYTAA